MITRKFILASSIATFVVGGLMVFRDPSSGGIGSATSLVNRQLSAATTTKDEDDENGREERLVNNQDDVDDEDRQQQKHEKHGDDLFPMMMDDGGMETILFLDDDDDDEKDGTIDSDTARRLRHHGNLPSSRRLRKLGTEQLYPGDHGKILNLRGLYLGTDRSMGFGLHPSKRALKAFPYKTTLDSVNLSRRGTGPSFPALCLQSMIGNDEEEVFDFVVFEYTHLLREDGVESKALLDLARRVRTRYPEALLIFLIVPFPNHYLHLPTGKSLTTLMRNHSMVIGTDSNMQPITEDMLERVTSAVQPPNWRLNDPMHQRRGVMEASDAVGGHVWTPVGHRNENIEHLKHLGTFFLQDGLHYSETGHDRIAFGIRNLLVQHDVTISDSLGPWGSVDKCYSWFQSGRIRLEHSDNLIMHRWVKKRDGGFLDARHALEVKGATGWIKVTNPKDRNLNLYLFYMATSTKQFYPHTEVLVLKDHPEGESASNSTSVKEKTSKRRPPVLTKESGKNIFPKVDEDIFGENAHLIRATFLGVVSPGDHYLYFHSLQPSAMYPFRVTGIAMSEEGSGGSYDGIVGFFG